MRILVAPDKFKGSLTAAEAARAIAAGLPSIAEIDLLPIGDGGEGTARVLCDAMEGEWRTAKVRGPLGREVEAGFGVIGEDAERLAVLEMSAASGLVLVDEDERDPWRASTFGTGQLVLAAAETGAKRLIVGIGGSATNDGGVGMAQAIGFAFLDASGEPLDDLPARLPEAGRIVGDNAVALPSVVVACDVGNPLLGERGATRMYGPQKGVDPSATERHESRLAHLADLVAGELEVDFRDTPGAGAAGGLGFGFLSFCNAELRAGFDLVAETTGMADRIAAADLVITGEGSLDAQTLMGKGPAGVARWARNAGKPVFAVCGKASERRKLAEIFDAVFALCDQGVSEATAIEEAAIRLETLVEENVLAGRIPGRHFEVPPI